ncbi:Uncharacterised protein [Mycobacterium tuberculosis]|uniref:Uncharacterized protein n=1 Tax=Mycobacterium tuberculosis TaxID=1773 RepID=A0A916LG42_MYCTX|nr:Uncharacterised protein [Mycobacterium tuberculosis]
MHCRASHRNQPLLTTLAAQQHRSGVGVDVVEVKADGLGDPRPGRVQQFQHRTVSQRQRAVGRFIAARTFEQR